jgi:ribosomal protein S18 acetylase RimI-like enzyme
LESRTRGLGQYDKAFGDLIEESPVAHRNVILDGKEWYYIMSDPSIRAAVAADAEHCLAALTLAFSSDPPCRLAWPDPQQYLEAFPRFARAFGGGVINHGTAHYYEGFSGVALWLPPGAAPDEESVVKVIENAVADERKGAMSSMFEQMDVLHPQEAHWHLPLIGVDPARQGKGIGSALLSHILNVRWSKPAGLSAFDRCYVHNEHPF